MGLKFYNFIKTLHRGISKAPTLSYLLILTILIASISTLILSPNNLLQLFCLLVSIVATALLSVAWSLKVVLRYLVPKVHFSDYASLYKTESKNLSVPRSLDQMQSYISELYERYDLLTTNVAASIIIQRNTGEIVFCSPYTQVLTGYSSEEIVNRSPEDFFASLLLDDDKERYQRAKQVAAIGEDILVRVRINHRSAISLWLEIRLIPICDASGNSIAIMTVANDVTDSLNYQKLIEQQNQDLNDFSYMISHDLKSPIFTIKGMTTAIKQDYSEKLGKDGNEALQFISDAANRLEKLVSSLLEYSSLSLSNDQESNVNLEDVVQAVLRDCNQQIKESSANVELKGDLPTVHGPELRLYQVFSNLISNAIKYRDPQRQLLITITSSKSVPGFATIAIKDNGQGIIPSKIDSIFRAFHRAHGSEIEGSGIGLACVKKIIDKLGGDVSVESKLGTGSIFYLNLPLPLPEPQSIPKALERAYLTTGK